MTTFEHNVIEPVPEGWERCTRDNCDEGGKWGAGVDRYDLDRWNRRHDVFEWRLGTSNEAPRGFFVIHQLKLLRPPQPQPINLVIADLVEALNSYGADYDDEVSVYAVDLRRVLNYLADVEKILLGEKEYVIELKAELERIDAEYLNGPS